MIFITGAVALSLIAALSLLLPLWFKSRRRQTTHDERHAVVALIRERLAELEQERAAGLLDATVYEQLVQEQQRRLLEESAAVDTGSQRRGAGLLLGIVAALVPLAAFLIYGQLGALADWRIQQLVDQSQSATSTEAHRNTLDELAPLLEQQIERRGDEDGRRRFLLARVEMERSNAAAAAVQYGSLAKQFPQDASIAGQHAQALYLASGRQLTPQIRAEAERALQIDANQTTALGLLGIAAFERGEYPESLKHWRKLLAQLPPQSPNARVIADGIRRAEAMAGESGSVEPAADAGLGPRLAVTVSIDEALKTQIPAGATLFVFVRAASDKPMPLAVVRQPVGEWPATVELSDAQAMAPGMNLSSLVAAGAAGELVARITASGQVRAQPGDFEGIVALDLEGSAQQIGVTIERRL